MVIIYDVTDPASYSNLRKWLQEVEKHGSPNAIKVFAGNKTDLSESRKIKKEEAENQSDEYGIRHFEVSAKDNSNIEILFESLARQISNTMDIQPKEESCTIPLNKPPEKKKGLCNI